MERADDLRTGRGLPVKNHSINLPKKYHDNV